jgi:uncharacterized protein YdbL (DUF1318 family)
MMFGFSTRKPRFAVALALGSVAVAVVAMAGTAYAQQRDPAYAAARAAGQVGEKPDGYLGYPTPPSQEVRRIAEDINIKRRALYAEKAVAQSATIDSYAMTSGCRLILQTAVGEKYQAPDGSWQTRGAGAPLRDARCP